MRLSIFLLSGKFSNVIFFHINKLIDYPCMYQKRALEKSSALVYNLLRKVIGYDSDLPSVYLLKRNSIKLWTVWDAISFYCYDCLCMIEDSKLQSIYLAHCQKFGIMNILLSSSVSYSTLQPF